MSALVPQGPPPSPALLYLARLAPGSRESQASALRELAALGSVGFRYAPVSPTAFPWHDLTYPQTAAIRAALAARYRPATVNRLLCALRGVLRECWRAGTMTDADYHRAIDVPGIRETKGPTGRVLPAAEIAALFRVACADVSARGVRDRAILAVAWAGGLRRAELVGLTRADCAELPMLSVLGKGNKRREVPLPERAADYLRAWLQRSDALPVFVGLALDGTCTTQRLDRRAVSKILGRRAAEAGIPPVSPHDFRRSYATALLEAGADPMVVARLLGHADVRTTMRYDRRGLAAASAAVNKLEVP